MFTTDKIASWAEVSTTYLEGLRDIGVIEKPDEGPDLYSEASARRVVTALKTRRWRLLNDTQERWLGAEYRRMQNIPDTTPISSIEIDAV